MKNDLENQFKEIKSGALEILPEADLRKKLASGRPLVVKLGVDPTAPDLHLGHAVPLRKLRQFQDFGHQVVLIIGDFTALIGDPSGRSKTRPQLTTAEIKDNAKTYTDQAFKILDENKTRLVFNSDWLAPLTMEQVLALVGKFTVTALLQRDDFERRYRESEMIGLHEFLYPVMQAYDSVFLKADIELGGSDQKFNLLAGRELQMKMGEEPQVCITLPLLEGADGVRKMSKSYGNHIGLTFKPVDMVYALMRVPDELLGKYFRLATLMNEDEIEAIEKGLADESIHPRDAHLRLAGEIVTIYYDAETATEAKQFYIDGASSGLSSTITGSSSVVGSDEVVIQIPSEDLKDGTIWLPRLVQLEGAATSNGAARRLVSQGGVRLNGTKLTDPNADLAVMDGDVIEVGKRPRRQIRIA